MIVFFLIFFIISQSFAKDIIEDEIKIYENKLTLQKQKIFEKEKKTKELKRILVLFLLKKKLIESEFLHLTENNHYFNKKIKYEIYQNISNILVNQIEKMDNELKVLKKNYEENYKKLVSLREKYYKLKVENPKNLKEGSISSIKGGINYTIDPVTGKPIKEGKYSKEVSPGVELRSPIKGIVKKIGFSDGVLSLLLENPKCIAYIYGLSTIKVSLQEEVQIGQIIGMSSFTEGSNNLYFEIFCNK